MDVAEKAGVRVDRQDAVLILVMNNPPVNALGHAVRAGIAAALDLAEHDRDIRALVIRAEGRGFSAGADIREFGAPARAPVLTELCSRIDDFPKPVVAAIHGMALGGGLELALAAQGRVGMTGARLGLPEVKLGLLPGAGGTQRLPRLVGAAAALRLIMGGLPVDAAEAMQLGLLDEVCASPDAMLTAAVSRALALADTPGFARAGQRRDGFHDPSAYEAIIAAARRGAAKDRLPAPAKIVDCIEAALLLPLDLGLAFERAAFEDLRQSPEAAGLRYAFLAEKQADHLPPGVTAGTARQVSHLGIWGAGAAAAPLTGAALRAGLKVTLCDPSPEALVSVLESVAAAQEAAVDAGQLTLIQREEDWARLVPATDPMAFAGAGALILTDAEKPLIVDFARGLAPDIAVLVAGGVPAGATGDVMGVVFAPGPLAELSRVDGVSPDVLATGLGLLRKIGRKPVITGAEGRFSSIGPQVQEAGRIAAEALIRAGVPGAQVVRAAAPVLRVPADDRQSETDTLIAMRDDAVQDRILAAMANAGARLITWGIARQPSDVDVIMTTGYGFPQEMGGPMFQADRRGLMVMRRNLRIWAAEHPIWEPDPLFDAMIGEGRGFGWSGHL